jgi:hypothetical protein
MWVVASLGFAILCDWSRAGAAGSDLKNETDALRASPENIND